MLFSDVDSKVGIIGMNMREAHLYVIALALLSLNGNTIRRSAPDAMSELALSIDVEFKLSATIHIHHIFTSLAWGEDRLILSREILKLYARGEVVHTKGGDCQRRSIILCSDRLALHIAIVPESALHTLLALKAALRCHEAFQHFVVG